MQGQRSSLTTLPENLSFDHATMTGETGIESQMPWSNMQTSAQNHLPEYRLSTNGTNGQAIRLRLGGSNAQWGSGEASSTAAQNHVHGNEGKIEQHSRNLHSRAGLTMRQYEPSNVISLDNDEVDFNGNLATTGSFVSRNSSPDTELNMISGFGDDDEDDDCQIVEPPSTYASVGSSSVLRNEDIPVRSSDGRRTSCKRKASEVQVGTSSGAGNMNSFQNAERCQYVSIPGNESEVGLSSGAGNSNSSQSAKRCHWAIPGKAVELQVGPSSGQGNSNSSLNAERSHWAPIPGKAVEMQVGLSSGPGNSNSSRNAERSHWASIPGNAVEMQVGPSSGPGISNSSQNAEKCMWVEVGPSSGAGNSTSLQNAERCQWVSVPGKEFEVGPSSGAGNATSLQNDKRCQWVPIPGKAVQVGQSSGAGNSNSLQNAQRGQWVPIPGGGFEVGPSSGAGNSNSSQNGERCQWVPIPADPIDSGNVTLPMQNETVFTNPSEHANPRLRLGVGGAVSAGPFSLTSGNPESSRRNFRVRINGSPYRDPIAPHTSATEADIANRDVPLTRHSARLLRNNVLDLNPVPPAENNVSPHEQYIASARRNPQTRWSRASSSRNTRSSTPAIPEPTEPIPRSISEHPIFVPAATEAGSLSEHPTGWNVASGNTTTAGNVVSASAAGSSSGVNLSAPAWSHRNRQERPRRLSEIFRRSVLLTAGSDSGSQAPSPAIGSSSSLTPEEMAILSGSNLHDRVGSSSSSRSAMLERNLDLPFSLRSLATATEGRSSSIMTEIRHVLNLMRRGEGLRFEDVMLLDHSVFLGMADMHDRHRDMRLDVDNMSYEELLALEERIGDVCTGLNDETIKKGLKQRKYVENASKDQVDIEPCSICREEYNNGEDLGTLECGHDFHRDCIKQWLVQKNSCPICKKAGLST